MSVEILGKSYSIEKTTFLDLSVKNLSFFPKEICDLTNLQRLCLHGNKITNIPPEIGKLVNLKELHLIYNQITNIPPEIGKLVKLECLTLDNNQITSIPSEFANLINLEKIYLSNNKITNIPLEILKIKEKLWINESGYDINNLDIDCEIIILNFLKAPLTNLPIGLKEIWLSFPTIDINQIKIPFGCKVYVNNVLKN